MMVWENGQDPAEAVLALVTGGGALNCESGVIEETLTVGGNPVLGKPAVAFTTPALVEGTALQNTTAYDETWYIEVTGTGAQTVEIQVGPTGSVADTTVVADTIANAAVRTFVQIVPAGFYCKVTTAATIGTVTALNRA